MSEPEPPAVSITYWIGFTGFDQLPDQHQGRNVVANALISNHRHCGESCLVVHRPGAPGVVCKAEHVHFFDSWEAARTWSATGKLPPGTSS